MGIRVVLGLLGTCSTEILKIQRNDSEMKAKHISFQVKKHAACLSGAK